MTIYSIWVDVIEFESPQDNVRCKKLTQRTIYLVGTAMI